MMSGEDPRAIRFATVLVCVFMLLLPTFIKGLPNYTANTKTIASLNAEIYPKSLNFPVELIKTQPPSPNMTCAMNITGPQDKILAFQIVYLSWSTINDSCQPGQYIEIFDGSSTAANSLFKECKKYWNSHTIFTSGSNGYIELKTGVNTANTVVFIKIHAIESYECPGVVNLTASPSQTNNITSPYYYYTTFSYPPNTSCSWRIEAPSGHSIMLQSDTRVNCEGNDRLEIYNSNSPKAEDLLGKLCYSPGEPYRTLFSTGKDMYIYFQSNETFQSQWKSRRSFVLYYSAIKQVCRGGEVTHLNASSSITKNISSPGYDKGLHYPPLSNCSWRITAPDGYVVKLQAKSRVSCGGDNDRLEIYDSDIGIAEDLLDSLCTTSSTFFYSTGRNMYISFSSKLTSQSSIFQRYFLIYYSAFKPETTCSSSNTAEQNQNILIRGSDSGIIQSPNFPNPFPNNLDCIWKIYAPPEHVVNLYVDTIDLKADYCLTKPFLKILDGYQDKSPTLKDEGCSWQNNIQPSFSSVSSGKRLGVHFSSGSKIIKGYGFKANYTIQRIVSSGTCGEGRAGIIHLSGQASSIKSPGFPLLYSNQKHPKNMTCLWNITVDQDYVIKVTIVDNKLTKSCGSDEYARFIDGATMDKSTMFTLCSDNNPGTRYTTGNSLLIELKTSSLEDRGQGFFVSYRAERKAPLPYSCTKNGLIMVGNLTAQLASYDYPLHYPNNAYCQWRFEVPFGRRARVTITKLDLQYSSGCEADYVSVTGGDHYLIPTIGRFCGKPNTPIVLTSSGRKLAVKFRSDWSGRYPGFEGGFGSVRDDSFGMCTVQDRDNFIPLSTSSGVLFSPRYPNYYPTSMSCTWLITVPEGRHVKLIVKDFDLDYFCQNAFLEVRDGSLASSKMIGRYCGSKKLPSIFSSGRQLWVRFTSNDKFVSDRGFKAEYDTVSTLPLSMSCRGSTRQSIKSSTGQIASFEYPLNYGNNVTCEWSITVSSGKRVKLTFDSFSLEDSSGCKGDHVALYDGYYGELLGKYCGSKTPDPVHSSGSTMYIKFATDGKGQYKGFKASFESVLSIQSIILIVTFTLMGFGMLLSLIGWCLKAKCLGMCDTSSTQPPPPDGTSVAGSNIQLTERS